MNSVAIVTGASQGIGRSTAIRLACDFSAILLVARNANALKELPLLDRKQTPPAFWVFLDSALVLSKSW